MSALPKRVENRAVRPGPVAPVKPALDKFGRDPESPSERLRRLSDYENDTGYGPLYAAWVADLPRLSSGQVCTLFLLAVNVLSLGRPDNPKGKGKRHVWTLPISVEELAALCRCNIREIQRQLKDLKERGMIAVKTNARGLYSLSLLHRDWQKLPDYQSGLKVVSIDDPEDAGDDGEVVEVEKDAVRLCRRPQIVNAGRAGRPITINVGVKRLRWQNTASLPLAFDAVVQSGELVISTRLASDTGAVANSEDTANAPRRGSRRAPDALPVDKGLSSGLAAVFDPLLKGGRLLSADDVALRSAVAAMGGMPLSFLTGWLTSGSSPRASRAVSSPKVVASIIHEAAAAWSKGGGAGQGKAVGPVRSAGKGKGGSFVSGVKAEAARRISRFGKL